MQTPAILSGFRSTVPSSGLLNLVWDSVLCLIINHEAILLNIPDQIKETGLGDS